MPIPPHIQRRVAHIDTTTRDTFGHSVSYWRLGFGASHRWSSLTSQPQPVLIGREDALVIDCDSGSMIQAPDGGVIHVNGDLNADLEAGRCHEVVIRGNVSSQATIRADGASHIYIGGSVIGRIETKETAEIWVDGDFSGSLATGFQSTRLNVLGDFNGTVSSIDDDPSLFYLCVDGFVASRLIDSIRAIGYYQFNATVGQGDVEPGLYPNGPGRHKTKNGESHYRWCVLSRRNGAEPRDAPESSS